MDKREIIEFIEQKRRICNKKVQGYLNNREISDIIYHELILLNEQLAENIKKTFIKGENLIKKNILENETALWDYVKKPENDIEAFEVMRKIILEDSKNSYIRKFALKIAEESSRNTGIPVSIPPVHELYTDTIFTEEVKNVNAFVEHCEKVARYIYEYIISKAVYVSDPPDDYYQRAYHTLEILDFRGDCDDFAILLCSALRSIGYRTFLAFQPHHVFAGVILAKVELAQQKRLIRYVEVPLDSQLNRFQINFNSHKIVFNVFDVVSGAFLEEFSGYIKEKSRSERIQEEDVEKVAKDMENIVKKLSELSKARIFFIDEALPTVKIVDIFKREISKFLSLVKAD